MLDAPRHTARQIAELEAKLAQREKDVLYQSNNYQATHAKWAMALRELARVKAESLRVVPDGGACAAGDARGNHTFIMRGGDVFMSEPHLWDWVRIDGTYAELNDDIFVQPVRLERWEKHG